MVSQIEIWNVISDDHVYMQIKCIRTEYGDPPMRQNLSAYIHQTVIYHIKDDLNHFHIHF